MDEAQLESHRLLIVPGGNYIHIGDGIAPSAATNIHNAVQNGLNYLGICAGAILAGESKVTSFNLAPVKFDFYADVNRRIHKNAVAISRPASPTVEHYWEDGPQLTGWGAVVGKYPNGTPAIVQGSCGKGWVVLCGTHPEAPANWRGGMNFQTPVSASHDCAAELIDAALNGAPLPHY